MIPCIICTLTNEVCSDDATSVVCSSCANKVLGMGKEKLIELRDTIKKKGRIEGAKYLDKIIGGVREDGEKRETGQRFHSRKRAIRDPGIKKINIRTVDLQKRISAYTHRKGDQSVL